jgi:hypothetical protein
MGLIERLLAAPEGVNPAVEMSERIAAMARAGQLDQDLIAEMLPQIEKAANQGERDLRAAESALTTLRDADSVAAREVPLGF